MNYGPPSVRNAPSVTGQFAGNVNPTLPAPATPSEISQGFNLNSPGQTQPEAIPVPANPEPVEKKRPRPQTPAEAFKPITEPSEVDAHDQEEIPTPEGAAEPYRTLRAGPSPSALPPTGAGPTTGIAQQPGSAANGAQRNNAVQNMMRRAPVRFSDSEQFSLEYELEAVGVRGVEAIELYGSDDGGQSWELWGSDPDRASPFDIQTKESGVFGFRIVVVGRSGLASPRPMSGEAPDIVVVVDRERPVVRITGAQYGEGDRIGCLVIQYECSDAHLKERPVALSFSDGPEGTWTTIAAGLRNDGQYIWKADPHLPRQLFLRIDATDAAGNTTSSVLDQPIDAQGLAPRARIRGFQTISGFDSPGATGQTATRPKASFK